MSVIANRCLPSVAMRSPVPIYDCHGHVGVHPDFPAYKHTPTEMIRVMDLLNIEVLAITSTRACCNDCPRGNAEVAGAGRGGGRRCGGCGGGGGEPAGEGGDEVEGGADFRTPPLIKLHP